MYLLPGEYLLLGPRPRPWPPRRHPGRWAAAAHRQPSALSVPHRVTTRGGWWQALVRPGPDASAYYRIAAAPPGHQPDVARLAGATPGTGVVGLTSSRLRSPNPSDAIELVTCSSPLIALQLDAAEVEHQHASEHSRGVTQYCTPITGSQHTLLLHTPRGR